MAGIGQRLGIFLGTPHGVGATRLLGVLGTGAYPPESDHTADIARGLKTAKVLKLGHIIFENEPGQRATCSREPATAPTLE